MKKEKLICDRNRKLYERVREKYKVNLKKNTEPLWGSYIDKDAVIVSHWPTKYPEASFTHELLHIDTQLEGYNRIRAGISLNQDTQAHLPRLIACLDNEFQHHKMFEKFVLLGFPGSEFYNDSDLRTVLPHLETVVSNPGESFISLSVDYLTLIAPGGGISQNKFDELKQLFHEYENKKYLSKFLEIDKIIADWKADNSYDAEKYIIAFFRNLNAGKTWITYSEDNDLTNQNFPSTGFFTDASFTVQDIAKAFA